MRTSKIVALVILIGLCVAVQMSRSDAKEKKMSTTSIIADSPEQIQPITVGQPVPRISLKTVDGTSYDLNAAFVQKPTVLVFYRGGWCPYCNLQLSGLQKIEQDLLKAGFQIIAVSPDRPEKLKESVAKHALTCRLLSDNEMSAATALGVAFHLNNDLVAKYKNEYKIDIEGDSGHAHHLLPVPAVFIVGKDGVIQFLYFNPDYRVRLDSEELLSAARAYLERIGTTDSR